jgi:hypothetical protein
MRQRTTLNQFHIGELLHGFCFFSGEGFHSDEEAKRQAWEASRAELLREWIGRHPGTRPWAWWAYDAPEGGRRRRLNGVHPFDCPKRRAHVNKIAKQPDAAPDYLEQMHKLSFGVPNAYCVEDDWKAEYESEADFLKRYGLLTSAEARPRP